MYSFESTKISILFCACEMPRLSRALAKKNYTTFINSSWVIFERNMRVVVFWTMCHHSLGHEKKALLNSSSLVRFSMPNSSSQFELNETSSMTSRFPPFAFVELVSPYNKKEHYTLARRYEFYVLVARTISRSFASLTREILLLPLEHNIHIFSPPCNILYI